jgi:ADP-ribosylglycohydrolase
MMAGMVELDRQCGTFLGLAIGDALGAASSSDRWARSLR